MRQTSASTQIGALISTTNIETLKTCHNEHIEHASGYERSQVKFFYTRSMTPLGANTTRAFMWETLSLMPKKQVPLKGSIGHFTWRQTQSLPREKRDRTCLGKANFVTGGRRRTRKTHSSTLYSYESTRKNKQGFLSHPEVELHQKKGPGLARPGRLMYCRSMLLRPSSCLNNKMVFWREFGPVGVHTLIQSPPALGTEADGFCMKSRCAPLLRGHGFKVVCVLDMRIKASFCCVRCLFSLSSPLVNCTVIQQM